MKELSIVVVLAILIIAGAFTFKRTDNHRISIPQFPKSQTQALPEPLQVNVEQSRQEAPAQPALFPDESQERILDPENFKYSATSDAVRDIGAFLDPALQPQYTVSVNSERNVGPLILVAEEGYQIGSGVANTIGTVVRVEDHIPKSSTEPQNIGPLLKVEGD